jgi:hypothetical protein
MCILIDFASGIFRPKEEEQEDQEVLTFLVFFDCQYLSTSMKASKCINDEKVEEMNIVTQQNSLCSP